MRKVTAISKETIMEFNKFRESSVGKTFSFTELIKELKRFGFSNHYSVSALVEMGVLTKHSRGKYSFCEKPVYIEKLLNAKKLMHRKCVSKSSKLSLEDAIKMVKDAGLRVQKPVFDAENALLHPKSLVGDFISYIDC